MRRSYSSYSDIDPDFDAYPGPVREVVVRRPPSPGIAAVLSVVLPGLGQVYSGRLCAGALWFLGTGFAYWAVVLPGFFVHALCIWSAWRGCPDD